MLTRILLLIICTYSIGAQALDPVSFYPSYKGDNCYLEVNICYVMEDLSNACRLKVYKLKDDEVDYDRPVIAFTKGAKISISNKDLIIITDSGFRRTRARIINYKAELNNLVVVPGVYSINPELIKFDLKVENGIFSIDRFACKNLHAIDEE